MTRFDCHHLSSMLDELAEGRLGEDAAAAARSHLEACESCRRELASARQLAEATRLLPRSIEPARDLWPNIAERIDSARVVRGRFDGSTRPGWRRWMTIAAAAAVLVLSVGVAYLAGLRQATPAIEDHPRAAPGLVTAGYRGATDELEQARDLLRVGLDRRRDQLSPETWAVVMENMAVIDDAIVRIETALEDNPNDGRLNRQLALAYRRQIDLLQRATRLPAEA